MNQLSPTFGCVVLTQGNRKKQLQAALSSLLGQEDVEIDVVVVGNGWQPTALPEGVKSVHIKENLGIPAGRNSGVNVVNGDLLFFLDDSFKIVYNYTKRIINIDLYLENIGLSHPSSEDQLPKYSSESHHNIQKSSFSNTLPR